MRVIAAYLLAQLGGNAKPDAVAINKILASVGVEAESEQVEKLLAELKDKNIEDVIAVGMEKMQFLPAEPVATSGSKAEAESVGKVESGKTEAGPDSDDGSEDEIIDLFDW
jgi:large subunit ribosomal protein LP2